MKFFLDEVFGRLVVFTSFSVLIPFVVALFYLSRRKSMLFKLLLAYVLLLFSSEFLGWLTLQLGTKNNLWITNIFVPIEFVLLGAIFYYCLPKPAYKWGIIAAAIVVTALSAFYAITGPGLTQVNPVPKMTANTLIIGMAVLYFFKIANDLRVTFLDHDPVFLLSCGLVIHKAGTSMSYAMFTAALAESWDAAKMCLVIIVTLNMLFYASLVLVLKRTPEL